MDFSKEKIASGGFRGLLRMQKHLIFIWFYKGWMLEKPEGGRKGKDWSGGMRGVRGRL